MDKGPKNRAAYDMRRYYNSIDISEWWEEFYTAVNEHGWHKYTSVRKFVYEKTDNPRQRHFLCWALGPPKPVNETMMAMYGKWMQPQDWIEKRETGGWFTEENLKIHSQAIRQKINALEALQAAGNGVIVNSLVRLERLAQQVDKEFGGRLFSPDLPLAANKERSKLYLDLHSQLLVMLARAQDLYAKSHGINYNDMSGFEQLLAAQLVANNSKGQIETSRSGRILAQIVDMTLEKSLKYPGAPVPEEIKDKIVTMSRAEESKRKAN